MKLAFNKEKLTAALGIVSRAIPTRTTNPILSCILFDASEDKVTLIANDSEFGISTEVEGIIREKGKVALDARLVGDIIRKLEGGDELVNIETEANFTTKISCSDVLFTIPGRDGEEFSYLPQIEREHSLRLSQFTLKEVIRKAIFAAALNDSNKMMGGEFVNIKGRVATFVALDGHRVAVRSIALREGEEDFHAIIPGKTMNEISKIMEDDNEKEVELFFSKNHVLFSFDGTLVLSRLIDGEYFKIEHMLSKDYVTRVEINRVKFLGNIDRATILIKESDHKPIVLDIRDGKLQLKVKSSYGSMDGEVPCEKSGNDLLIAFNPKFLMDALRAIDDETVTLYFTNAKSPCFLRDEHDSFVYLILPVNFVA